MLDIWAESFGILATVVKIPVLSFYILFGGLGVIRGTANLGDKLDDAVVLVAVAVLHWWAGWHWQHLAMLPLAYAAMASAVYVVFESFRFEPKEGSDVPR